MAEENPMLATIHTLRELIADNELIIFLGEHTSAVATAADDNQPCSLDAWWDIIDLNDAKKTRRTIGDLETRYIQSQPQKQSRIHNILRTVGTFPLILTTNVDHLLERFYWKSGADGDKIRIDQIGNLPTNFSQQEDHNIIIKCYGDTDLLTRVSQESKEFFSNLCKGTNPDDVTAQRLHSLFDSHSVLFLGCDFNHPIYQELHKNFILTSKRKHHTFQTSPERHQEDSENLTKIYADLQLWEFVQYLSAGGSSALQDVSVISGQVIELSFLPSQREEYLKLQLHLEQHAVEIAFHTSSVTNALATDELLDRNSRPSLEKIYKNDPFGTFSSTKVDAALQAMKNRRNNLWKVIDTSRNVKVVVVFLYQSAEAEVDPAKQKNEEIRRLALSKYAKVLLRAKSVLSTKSSLELRIVDGKTEDDQRRLRTQSFGIFKMNDGVDEASCFAQQALRDKAASHLVMFNGAEVTRHRRILETSIGRAWDAETSLLRLAALILKHNGHEDGKGAIDPKELTAIQEMYDVQVITSKPDYDPRTLYFLGRGAFGEVYKVTDKAGKTFAIKMLKELETSDVTALEKFKNETESMRKVSHPNIVKLEEVMREGHRLCIKMEFVDGCELRKIIEPRDGQPSPQSKEFVLRAAKQIGSALAYLHEKDLIHGDVKAENVMVTSDRSTLKLTDFGLARNAPKDVTQTRTMQGSMRYMAPEVAIETRTGTGKAKYSNKADVYSYGLLMIEVISGHYIFEEYIDPKVVLAKKVDGTIDPRIPVDCEEKHGPIITQVISGCLKYQYRSRPSMHEVSQILEGKVDALRQTKGVQLLCLGTGKGVTAAVHGEPSSSMVIINEGKPVLLVDMGLGVIKAYQSMLGEVFPKDIFITHNHSDHSGELALGGAIAVQKLREKNLPFKMKILCGPEVLPKLRDHRIDEIYSAIPKEHLSKFIEWTTCPAGDKMYLDKDKTMYLISHKSQHSEITYGFNLYLHDKNILGFSADSGFNQAVYDKIYEASTVVVDAREESTKEHASFDEVIEFGNKLQTKPHRVYVTGYGRQDEWPDKKDMTPASAFTPGELYTLWPVQANA